MRLTKELICQEAWRHRSALTAFAYVWLKDWSSSEDVVQEAFLIVAAKWSDVKSLDGVHAWVRTIVRFKVMEMKRNRRRYLVTEPEAIEHIIAGSVADYFDEEGDGRQVMQVQALQLCLQKLPKRRRAILEGYYMESKTSAQLSELFGASVNAIDQVLSRVRKVLKDCSENHLRRRGI